MLVDDERPARELLKILIDWEPTGFFIAAEASDGRECLEKYPIYKPALIIADIEMPSMDGIALMQAIREQNPHQLFIVLSCHELFHYAQKALKLGAIDYLIKDSLTPNELLDSLRKVEKLLPRQSIMKHLSGIASFSPRIRRVAEYILQNFDRDISLSLMAELFDIHKVHLARTFKEETGASIHEVILDLRLEKAKELLAGTTLKVADIIEAVGFSNPQYFYILFKKYCGVSPSEYRALNGGEEPKA